MSGASNWIPGILPTILAEYEPKDRFNADEFALFYKALPRGFLVFAGERPHGSKIRKERIACLLFVMQTTVFQIELFKC